jgi:DNA-binding transcriptional LysR family regulator
MLDEVSELRLLCHLVAAGSLSEAARRWGSSTPAVSRRLAAMEARLGVRLVNRTSRRFTLTEEGALLHERGVKILADISEAEAEACARVASPRGRIRVGAPMEFGRRRIAPLVAEFRDRYPNVGVELVLSDAGLELIEDGFDIVIRYELPHDQNVVAKKLLSSRRVVCASPAYFKQHGKPDKPEDLLGHECIRLVRGRRVFDRWVFRVGGALQEISVSGALSTTSGEVLHEWALAGKGIAFKAVWDVEADIRARRLVECLGQYSCDEFNMFAIFAPGMHVPPRVRVFIDYLEAALKLLK